MNQRADLRLIVRIKEERNALLREENDELRKKLVRQEALVDVLRRQLEQKERRA